MAGLINIGFGNVVNTNKIVTIINPDSAPGKANCTAGKGFRTDCGCHTGTKDKKYYPDGQ